MRTNKCGVTEVAHLRTDKEKYDQGWDRIFGQRSKSEEIVIEAENPSHEEDQRIKELARRSYQSLDCGQDTEGFPESSSYVYGFMEGYKKALAEQRK
jgi:hypothetical protein